MILLLVGIGGLFFSAYAVNSFYQEYLKYEALIQATQGMTEYEICQYAANKFDMKMVKDMGCMDGKIRY